MTLDWIKYKPNASVDLDGDYIYFLYLGAATISISNDACTKDAIVGSTEGACNLEASKRLLMSSRIIGDVQFAKALEASVYKTATTNSKSDKKSRKALKALVYKTATANSKSSKKSRGIAVIKDAGSAVTAPMSRFVVSPNGAAVLWILMRKLLQLMKNNTKLSTSIQRLLLICMQEKLSSKL